MLLKVDVVLTKLEDTRGVEDEMENLGFHHKWRTRLLYEWSFFCQYLSFSYLNLIWFSVCVCDCFQLVDGLYLVRLPTISRNCRYFPPPAVGGFQRCCVDVCCRTAGQKGRER